MNELPILLLDNFFIFPKCDNYLSLNDSNYLRKIFLRVWKDYQGQLLVIPNKDFENFAPVGTLAKINLNTSAETEFEPIINSLKEIPLKGLERVKIINLEKRDEVWQGEYQILLEREMNEEEMNDLTEKFIRYFPSILEKAKLNSVEKMPITVMRGNIKNVIDFIAQNSQEIDQLTRWKILVSLDLRERLEILISIPDRQKIDKEIEEKTREKMKDENEEYYLRRKLEVIEKKLKEKGVHGSSEIRKYLEKLKKGKYPTSVKKVVQEVIEGYERMSPAEASMTRTYLDWLINLPWWQETAEITDLELVRRKLDEKYYGFQKGKDRIIDYLVDWRKRKMGEPSSEKQSGKILCLVGFPGVGKTFFASCVAEAIGRKLFTISMGGENDVATIKGHRRTYIGSLPGEIVHALKKTEVINPLILIDEIDKIGRGSQGDPSHALLRVLDPKENKNFVDNYLGSEVPLDLSKVLFICTANSFDLSPPLLNRMEIIFLPSYTETEKLRIAKDYLIPKYWKIYDLTAQEIVIEDQTILSLIRNYTRESGVRELDRKIEIIFQKFNVQVEEKKITNLVVTPEVITQKQFLGKKVYDFTQKDENVPAGVVNGLAWTESGGDILPIEVNLVSGEGKLGELTGSLGKVMKESAKVAFSYVKYYLEKNKENFEKELTHLEKQDINIHAPEGAVEKEGPSAGIALTTAIFSALTDQKVPADIGMTGEITSKGKILKIGGLREKAVAAQRSGLKTILIPETNEPDIEDIPDEVRQGDQGLKIILVKEYEEVRKLIFAKKRKKTVFPIKKKISIAKKERETIS